MTLETLRAASVARNAERRGATLPNNAESLSIILVYKKYGNTLSVNVGLKLQGPQLWFILYASVFGKWIRFLPLGTFVSDQRFALKTLKMTSDAR